MLSVRLSGIACVSAASMFLAAGPLVCLAGSGTGTIVLNDDSYLREFLVFKTPVVIAADGQVKAALDPMSKEPKPVAEFQSPLPPADWTAPDFDDSTWDRNRAPVEVRPGGATGNSPAALHSATCSSLLCLRGKFVVDDPAAVQDLKLTLEYVGGVVVYVNGREVTRASLPAGRLTPDTLAEKYPDDLYCEPNGMYLQEIKKNPAGFARRHRRLADVAIPAALLRKGTNVLALEIHRSAINEAAVSSKRVSVGGMYVVPGLWSYAGLRSLTLTATGSGVAPNVGRPRGVQVWNCRPFETVQAFDYGDPGEPLRPILVSAARNSVVSGRLVVSSDEAIKGLKVTVGDLVQGDAKIPASAVRVRCAEPAVAGKSWAPAYRFDGLLGAIPAEIPVVKAAFPREPFLEQTLERKALTAGATAPVWLTVRVPADAKPGAYESTVTVSANGRAPATAPFRLTVYDWALPDPKDFRVKNLAFLSPESVARHYEVTLWSDRHFELMGKSLALMAEVNSRQVVIDLAVGFHGMNSNQQSVVRWVKQPDETYTYDFSILDKFLDLAAKTVGKPLPLRFNCWGEVGKDGRWANVTTVSLLDPATGTVSELAQPQPGEESYKFWKPILDEVRKRVEARGWFDVTSIGHNSYCYLPAPQTVSMYHRIWPDGVWSYTAHNGTLGARFPGLEKNVQMPCLYSECVWTEGRLTARGYKSMVNPRQAVWCDVARNRHRDWSPLTVLRDISEEMIMRGHDGLGQLGADIFPIKDRAGRYTNLNVGRGGLGPDCSTRALLAPGADGSIPTERFESFREGLQQAEAIIYLQRALDANRLSADLAERVNRHLDSRAEAFLRQWSADRCARDERLLSLAAEAAAGQPAK
jgi:hypothetical protein